MSNETEVTSRETLSSGFAKVEKIAFRRRNSTGAMVEFERDLVDAGDGATILPYDAERGKIILVRQFRGVAFLKEGREFLVEACAGKLEGADPLARIVKETEEETGIRLSGAPRRLFEAYSTPGSFAERMTYFVAPYAPRDRVSAGGGLAEEHEDIEVVEITLDEAIAMVERGEIVDAKTILLLYFARATGLLDQTGLGSSPDPLGVTSDRARGMSEPAR